MSSPAGKITFGKQLASLEVGGFILTETLHRPGMVLPRHEHECANFNLTVSGYCLETIGRQTVECGSSSLVLKPGGEAHANRYGPEGAHCLIVEVTPPRLAGMGSRRDLFDRAFTVTGGPLVALATRMYVELSRGACGADLVIEGLALEFLGQMARRRSLTSGSAVPGWLREARDRIHGALAEPLGLSALAQTAGVDPGHFARAFRKWLGCSVGEYVRRLRLERSIEQLTTTERSLAEIADRCGFYDQSHFTNAFRVHVGMSPARYRAVIRSKQPVPRRSGASKTAQRTVR